jgi:hypothetical protein
MVSHASTAAIAAGSNHLHLPVVSCDIAIGRHVYIRYNTLTVVARK